MEQKTKSILNPENSGVKFSYGEKTSVVKPLNANDAKYQNFVVVILTFVMVFAGLATGWYLSGLSRIDKSQQSKEVGIQESKVVNTQKEAGISDTSKFTTSAEGLLVEGGINGEGTHHLQRPGGATQNVYLTSTVIDLQSFVGKEVTVWGDTISGMSAGWLMDVGRIKVND
ncbi:MAG: hypothetical protein NZM26_01660 [Patescibacteria group bacterium]|nr:hypothetical protein [Patescibacteria group bacterium]